MLVGYGGLGSSACCIIVLDTVMFGLGMFLKGLRCAEVVLIRVVLWISPLRNP